MSLYYARESISLLFLRQHSNSPYMLYHSPWFGLVGEQKLDPMLDLVIEGDENKSHIAYEVVQC